MWYQNVYRRHLCDMHIDDWNPAFLSRFDPEEYVQNLKRAHLQSAMLYFQSHVGLCYYPTRSGKMHKAWVGREDLMRRLVTRCHEEGIFVTGYYSLIYNTWAHDTHPDWRLTDQNGDSKRCARKQTSDTDFAGESASFRYGFCCPNNPDYRAFTEQQIREIAAYFPEIDGMFYDMLFWPHMCYCNHCRSRWEREVGGPIPTEENWNDERWLLHMQKRREWMGEFAHWATDLTKSLLPQVSVEHNVAYSALPDGMTANCEEVIDACDYAGGDLYRGIYGQSFACKFYRNISKNQPFEYMFSRCAPNLAAHTHCKSPDVMRSALFLTAAHHGATLVIDAVDPVGTMDARVYRRLGNIFDELTPYESYFRGEMIEDIGVYYSLKSKFNRIGEPYSNYLGAIRTVESLIAEHTPCGITGGFHKIDPYSIIVASCLTEEDAYDTDRLVSYVQNGGTLYISGGDCRGLLDRFFHATVIGRTKETVVYLVPKESVQSDFGHYNAEYPLPFHGSAPIVTGIAPAHVLATVTLPYTDQDDVKFASIHSNPPGIPTDIPAMALCRYGAGTVLWSALPIECVDLDDDRRILLRLLFRAAAFSPTLTSDAPDDVEITAFADTDRLLIHTVQLNTKQIARKLADFSITVRGTQKPDRVLRLPERTEIPCTVQDHTVTFSVKDPTVFGMYEIRYQKEP